MGRKKSRKAKVKHFQDLKIELEEGAEALFLESLEKIPADVFKEKVEDSFTSIENGSNRKYNEYIYEIDLHGMTLARAKVVLIRKIEEISDSHGRSPFQVKIITGKGIRSGSQGGVLSREIHGFISNTYAVNIKKIEASPDEVMINNLPIRGHFHVLFEF